MKPILNIFFLLCTTGVLQAQKTFIHCGTLLDCTSEVPKKEMTIIVEGNTIVDVVSGYKGSAADGIVVDLKDQTVMPGLTDMPILKDKLAREAMLRSLGLTRQISHSDQPSMQKQP
jgi:cytosine/adenosine deaminase-related metal-dependent hydrolase